MSAQGVKGLETSLPVAHALLFFGLEPQRHTMPSIHAQVEITHILTIWTPKTLTLSCVNKSGTAHGLTQCPIKGDTPYFTAVQFWILRRALQIQRKGQKGFPPQFWKQLYLTLSEGLICVWQPKLEIQSTSLLQI